MYAILFVLLLFCAGVGCWLLVDFLVWRAGGRVTGATITGFLEQKSRGAALPKVSFETEEGGEIQAEAQRIDQFLFLLKYFNSWPPADIAPFKFSPQYA